MQANLKCAIYTRVSTDMQAEKEFNSCETQESKIRSFIDSQENISVYRVYTDAGYTGANTNRPALQNMLADIRDEKINSVLTYKIDRLTRSPKDFYQLIELFDNHSVDFVSVTERFDTSTPSGRLLRNIMLTFAQFEREMTSERTKDKMIERARKGMWNGGRIPYGYRYKDKKLVVNKSESKIVRDIFAFYTETRSTQKIYEYLKGKNINIPKCRIPYILRNITYTGKISYAGKISDGNHAAIISEGLYNLAQDIHKKKITRISLNKNYALAGLIRCAECGSAMTPAHANKKWKGNLTQYYYYKCTSVLKNDKSACSIRHVNANRIEEYITENLERISKDKQYLDSIIYYQKNRKSELRVERCLATAKRSCSTLSKVGGRSVLPTESSNDPHESEDLGAPSNFSQTVEILLPNIIHGARTAIKGKVVVHRALGRAP